FRLGNSKLNEKGFIISDACIKCRKCERICPQKCIENYVINQNHCLHCGLCFEQCPVNAVERRGG
ncbi:MAG: 4Fe-4S binding protein, partial [Thomasclavelia spiroformis]